MFGRKKKPDINIFGLSNARLLFTQDGCPFCRMMRLEVKYVNHLLSPEKRIREINVKSHHPVLAMIKPKHTPTLYLDGYTLIGTTSEKYMRGFLYGYLRKTGEITDNYLSDNIKKTISPL